METLTINVTQAYLEMARSWSNHIRPETEVTPTVAYALSAQSYVFSYMAINSYTSNLLGVLWDDPQSGFRNKYPHRNSVAELLGRGGELSDLPTALRVLAAELQIRPIHEANGQLWNDFNQVVREARDYFIHPKPGPQFQQHIDKITRIPRRRMKEWWLFPISVAETIIRYFQTERGMIPPDWVTANQEFLPQWGIVPKDQSES